MITLNQIKNILLDYFKSHAMIEEVCYENDFDFNSERRIKYRVVNIEYLNSSINNKLVSHNYKFVIADLAEFDNKEIKDNILSDCVQIAEDFYTFIYEHPQIIFNRISTINPFEDDTKDSATGVIFTVSLSAIRSQNICDTPIK